jgi:hypothetical protein
MAEYHRIGKQAKKFFQEYSIKKLFPQVFKIEQIITNKKCFNKYKRKAEDFLLFSIF